MAENAYGARAPGSTTVVEHAAGPGTGVLKRISWPAVFAGVALVLSVQLLLSLLGIGIGLSTIEPLEGTTPEAGTIGIGSAIWWVISILIALVVGGYVAAWLSGLAVRVDGMLHGLLTWAVTLLVSFVLLTSALGGLIGGAFNVLGSTLSKAGEGVKSVAPQVAQAAGLTPDQIREQADRYLSPTNPNPATMSREDAQKAIAAEVPNLAAGGDRANQARERIITIMAAQMNVSREEAARRFDEAQAEFNETKQQAIETAKVAADETAKAVSRASLLGFVALLLGAGAGALGGSMGARRHEAVVTTTRTDVRR